MKRTLISFLGSPLKPKEGGEVGYRRTTYRFADGWTHHGRWFAAALVDWLKHCEQEVDRLVVVGTRGSMWVAFEDLCELNSETLELLTAIEEASVAEAVTQEQLDALVGPVSEQLQVDVSMLLIDNCYQGDEQLRLVARMAEVVRRDDRIVMDITHSYRHLPLLGMTAMFFLQRTLGCELENIYYGCYNPSTREAPVVELGSALQFLEVTEAVAAYQATGAVSPIAATLGAQVHELEQAAFFADTHQPKRARPHADRVLRQLEEETDPIVVATREPLNEALGGLRAGASPSPWRRQLKLGAQATRMGDYVRAALLLREAFVSAAVEFADYSDKGLRHEFEIRDTAKKALVLPTPRDQYNDKLLSALRNALAHGTRPSPDSRDDEPYRRARSALDSRDAMVEVLRDLASWLDGFFTRLEQRPG